MISLQNISLYNGSNPLLHQCSIVLDGEAGKKIALVGKNGCGKSSLLKILLGEIKPDKGTVHASHEVIGYLPQTIDFPDNHTLVGEYLESLLPEPWLTYKLDIALEKVGLSQGFLIKELLHLSGGEKVKVALVGLLLEEPTLLLFDEPTNNLDAEGISFVENFIKKFPGTVLFISHDRELINNASETIWELDHETAALRIYGSSYDDFLAVRNKRREHQLQQHEAQYKQIVALENWLKANEFHPKYRFSDLVLSQKQALENLRKNLIPKPSADPRIRPARGAMVDKGLLAKVAITQKQLPERSILQNISVDVHHGEKLLICGPNGTGKTTLLNILAGHDIEFQGTRISRPDLRIGYLKQSSTLVRDKTVLDNFLYHTYTNETEARATLAKYLFPTEFMNSKLSSLSMGEIRRLDLAIILTNKPQLLLLDEPTNHLDIFSREELECFIVQEAIPMVIVSHDRYFIEKISISRQIHL